MSQVEKLEALLAKIQTNREQPRSGATAAPMLVPPTSQTPISVAPVAAAPAPSVVESLPAAELESLPPTISSVPPAPVSSIPPAPASSIPPAPTPSEPVLEVGGPTDFPPAEQVQPQIVALPDVIVASGTPWSVIGTAAPMKAASFVDLLELSLSLKPR